MRKSPRYEGQRWLEAEMNDEAIKPKIVEIIRRHTGRLPEVKIFLFGSRAAGQHTLRSDFDIGLESTAKIPLATLAQIREELEQLPLLPQIDLVDFKRVSPEFARQARQHLEEW
jgi:predicted nucleotidyltransferase